MDYQGTKSEFPEFAQENLEVWNANAAWSDDLIGDGNEFQTHLIEPASERLLAICPGDYILDIACGAGRFARRMADGKPGRPSDCDRSQHRIYRTRTASHPERVQH